MTLYEIDAAINEFFASHIDPDTGEVTGLEELEQLQIDRQKKIENIALYYKNILADADAIKREKIKLADRQKRAETKAENLKNYLAYRLNGEKFESARVAVTYRKSEGLVIDTEREIPSEYLIPQEPKVDKTALKRAIKRGAEIAGVTVETRQNIQVK